MRGIPVGVTRKLERILGINYEKGVGNRGGWDLLGVICARPSSLAVMTFS